MEKKIQRNFHSHDLLQTVIQFIDTHELFTQEGEPIIPPSISQPLSSSTTPDIRNLYPHHYPYRVVTIHPRHVFSDASLQLKELGLGRNCLLIVETVADSEVDGEEEGEEEEDEP